MKSYLGDGVYVALELGGVMLTTENGIRITNRIFLELEVLDALERWLRAQRDPAPTSGSEGGES